MAVADYIYTQILTQTGGFTAGVVVTGGDQTIHAGTGALYGLVYTQVLGGGVDPVGFDLRLQFSDDGTTSGTMVNIARTGGAAMELFDADITTNTTLDITEFFVCTQGQKMVMPIPLPPGKWRIRATPITNSGDAATSLTITAVTIGSNTR